MTEKGNLIVKKNDKILQTYLHIFKFESLLKNPNAELMKWSFPYWLKISSLLLISLNGYAQETTEKKVKKVSLFNQLEGESYATWELTSNLEVLYNDRRYQNYHPGYVNLSLPNGDTINQEIRIKTRGKFRCRNCDYPPIKVKIPNKDLAKRNYKKINDFKFVYPCKDGEEFQNFIYKEYLAYKLYNLLTDYSLRVNLINVVIKDSLDRRKPIKFKGFIIEDNEEITKRLDGKKGKIDCVLPKDLAQEDYTTFQVFQYMIGNTDWLIPLCHNADLIKTEDEVLIPIPFDFDFSGLVSASYSSPNSNFPVPSVQVRYFQAHQKDLEALNPVFEKFKAKEDAMYELIKKFKHLPKNERFEMISYLKEFFNIIKKPKKIKKEFVRDLKINVQASY